MGSKKVLQTTYTIFAIALASLAGACSPQFNRQAPKLPKLPSIGVPAGPHDLVEGYDQYNTGGGAYGTGTGYKLSGVNITAGVTRGTGSGSRAKMNGGLQGQLPNSTWTPQ